MKIKNTKIPLYDIPFSIILSSSPKEMKNFFAKQDIEFERHDLYAHIIRGSRIDKSYKNEQLSYVCIYAVLNPKNAHAPLNAGTIAHEALHVVEAVWDRIGHEFSTDYPEPQNYLLGWIVNEMTDFVKKHE